MCSLSEWKICRHADNKTGRDKCILRIQASAAPQGLPVNVDV